MSTPDTPSTPDPAAASAGPAPQPAAAPARGVGVTVAWVALLLSAASLAAGVALWQRLSKTEEEMARRGTDTLAEAAAARTLAAQADAQAKDLQARLGVAEIRLSEVTLQRSQLEELMLSVSRSRDDSLVQDIESAIRLAIQQSQLTGSTQPLISALQGAEQRIERAAQPRLNPVQRAIARDIERIRAASLVDVPTLAASLDGTVRQLDELPLRNGLPTVTTAPVPEAASAPDSPAATAAATGAANAPADEAGPATAEVEASAWEQAWSRFNAWRSSTAARWWAQFRQGTADLIRVSRIDQPEAALLSPEQSYFLRENLKLQLLNARLGLLARQFDTARADVQTARTLVERYFDPAAPSTRLVLQTLTQLQQDLRQESLPRPDDTLAALTVAAGGR